ncbi:hypothetical protein S83_023730, partial [Arachis hypogaea]
KPLVSPLFSENHKSHHLQSSSPRQHRSHLSPIACGSSAPSQELDVVSSVRTCSLCLPCLRHRLFCSCFPRRR